MFEDDTDRDGDADADDVEQAQSRVRERKEFAKRKGFQLTQFLNETVYANSWTNSSLELLEEWLSRCESVTVDHTRAAKQVRLRNRQIAIHSIILGAAASELAFFSTGDPCDDTDSGPSGVGIGVTVLTSAFSKLGRISNLCDFGERQNEHIGAAGNFTNLSKIQVCIFLPMELRGPCEVVLTDVSGEFANLVNTSPLLIQLSVKVTRSKTENPCTILNRKELPEEHLHAPILHMFIYQTYATSHGACSGFLPAFVPI